VVPIERKAGAITCRELVKQGTEFLEDRLPAASKVEIWRHLESCASCRTYVEQLALVRDSLRRLRNPQMPDRMREILLRRLARLRRDSDDLK
jgi:predicted anti-sigma-YlaC factor YlaD